jgi:hypothetical protein
MLIPIGYFCESAVYKCGDGMSTPFLVLALISVAVGVVSSIAVTAYVSQRGVKINYFLWRIMIFQYFNEYVAMTKKEKGTPGAGYYTFVVAMILALVFVVSGIAVK